MDSSPQSTETCAKKVPHATTGQEEKTLKKLQRAQWLRAAILGANDGLLSTTSLMLGVGAAKDQDQSAMILSGVAGALAGACSMAVGEFVSVSTQRDITRSIDDNRRLENETKLQIVCSNPIIAETKQGDVTDKSFSLTPARSPIMKVMEIDAKRMMMEESNLENELKEPLPNPLKAAAASSLAFLCGAFVPMVPALVVKENRMRVAVIVIVASSALFLFGGIGAYLGGSSVKISAMRVLLGGWISMAITYGLLKPFDNDSQRDDDNDH